MALPKLNEAPKYELTVPSTQKKVKFRPFLVKEQKVLLIAHESKDRRQMLNSMLDTVKACVDGEDIDNLTTYDIDYIFTNIRGKSVGEKVEMIFKCEECDHENPYEINLDDVEVGKGESEKVVKLTDDISVKVKYPGYRNILSNDRVLNMTSAGEAFIDLTMLCMESIMTNDQNIVLKDEPREEVEKFIESMSAQQFQAITEFVQKMPTMTYHAETKCTNCGSDIKRTLQGVDDFF